MTASQVHIEKVEEMGNRLQVGRIHLRTSEDDMLSEHLANLEIEELRVRVPNEIRELVEPLFDGRNQLSKEKEDWADM